MTRSRTPKNRRCSPKDQQPPPGPLSRRTFSCYSAYRSAPLPETSLERTLLVLYVNTDIYTLRATDRYVKSDIGGYTITSLGYALLGLLAREPLSGYDLASRMKERVGFFWQARHSQIYPELGRLEGEGMVTHRVVEEQEQRHKEQLLRYEEIEAWMEREWGEELGRTDSPRFASYAALQRGLNYE